MTLISLTFQGYLDYFYFLDWWPLLDFEDLINFFQVVKVMNMKLFCFFLKYLFIYFAYCVCLHVICTTCMLCCQSQEEGFGSLGGRVGGGCEPSPMVQGTEPRYPPRTASALNCWAISPVQMPFGFWGSKSALWLTR